MAHARRMIRAFKSIDPNNYGPVKPYGLGGNITWKIMGEGGEAKYIAQPDATRVSMPNTLEQAKQAQQFQQTYPWEYAHHASPLDVVANQAWQGAKGVSSFFGADPDYIKEDPINGGLQALNTALIGELPVGKIYQASKQGVKTIVNKITNKIENRVTKNLADLNYTKNWATKYGYSVPSDLEKIAKDSKLTDKTIQDLVNQHNTFVRGISTNWKILEQKNPEILRHLEGKGIDWKNNPQTAAEYMSTHIPINTGYGRAGMNTSVFSRGQDALYTSNSIPTAEGYTYGDGYIVKVKRPTNFESLNRKDWIHNNRLDYYEHYLPNGNTFLMDGRQTHPNDLGTSYLYNLDDYETIDVFKNKILEDLEKSKSSLLDNLANRAGKSEGFTKTLQESLNNVSAKIEKIKNAKFENDANPLNKKLLKTEHTGPESYDFNLLQRTNDFFGKKTLEESTLFNAFLKKHPFTEVDNKILELGNKLNNLSFDKQEPIRKQILNLQGERTKLYTDAIKKYMPKHHPEFDLVDRYAHYIHIGTPGEKILEPISSERISPEIWKNKSRAHTNIYSKGLSAGSLIPAGLALKWSIKQD